MPKIELKNVSYSYQDSGSYAIKNVSYLFRTGLLYVILGPSGSGKSTLLSVMIGLDNRYEGEILYNNHDYITLDLDHFRRKYITMIFQSYQLFPLLTVLENVCFPLELQGISTRDAKSRAVELLHSLGIATQHMKRYPSRLSGGEQQRVAIARSLATGARFILADEPTGNLDLDNTKMIVQIFTDMVKTGKYCVIIVTHDANIAEKADIVLHMLDGHLIT